MRGGLAWVSFALGVVMTLVWPVFLVWSFGILFGLDLEVSPETWLACLIFLASLIAIFRPARDNKKGGQGVAKD